MAGWTKVASAVAEASVTINALGADVIVITCGANYYGTFTGPEDSENNVWTPIDTDPNSTSQLSSGSYYCVGPVTSASQTFQMTDTANAVIMVEAWSGSNPSGTLNAHNKAVITGDGTTTTDAYPSVTPTVDGTLILEFCVAAANFSTPWSTYSINDGFTIDQQQAPVNFGQAGGIASYLVQSTAAAIAPTGQRGAAEASAQQHTLYTIALTPAPSGTQWSGAALLDGAGSLSATATAIMQDGAALSGAGNLTVGAQLVEAAGASLSGAGSLSVAATHTPQGASALAGHGSLAVTASVLVAAAANFAGAGSLAASTVQNVAAVTALAGAGGLTVSPVAIDAITAILAGAGLVEAVATTIQLIGASFNGSGGMAPINAAVVTPGSVPSRLRAPIIGGPSSAARIKGGASD